MFVFMDLASMSVFCFGIWHSFPRLLLGVASISLFLGGFGIDFHVFFVCVDLACMSALFCGYCIDAGVFLRSWHRFPCFFLFEWIWHRFPCFVCQFGIDFCVSWWIWHRLPCLYFFLEWIWHRCLCLLVDVALMSVLF